MDTTLQDPLVGYVLDGRYRVEARIAVGGMATVYRAVDTRLDRVLALKVMHPGLAADGAFVDRFIREAKSVARLAHPNVVSVYDQGTDGSYVYLAMEYVAGCTLRDVLRERGALQPRAALDILEPVLAALGAAHRAGLVHRDMKPENVLIGADGRVKVADFGLVRAVDTNITVTGGALLGTVSYLAPEQIEDGTAGTAADVYACGVVLYEMLTGAKPRSGSTAAQVLYQHLHEDVPAPSAAVPGLAPALDGLVAAATARDPRARPGDAVALFGQARAVRSTLTDAELDAVPPLAQGTGEVRSVAQGLSDRTAAIPRGDRDGALNRTSVLQSPPASGGSRRARPRRGLAAVLAAVLLVFGVGVGVWYINTGQFTQVPGVRSLPEQEAVRKLQAEGLDVRAERAFSDVTDRGHVIDTEPGPGERIRDNGTVTMTVSRGPEIVKVPDLEGMPLAQAKQRLRDAGLEPGMVTERFSDGGAKGTVISTDPRAGSRHRADTAVALTVSKGEPVEAPDVIGLSLPDARQELREAGLRVEVSGKRVHSEEDRNTVAEQVPSEGDEVARGDTVTLTLSKGPQLVEVPDVEGQSLDEAKRKLEDAGFTVDVSRFFFGDTVFDQSVNGGEKAPRGSTIKIRVR
ncbi:Stk1 family PASTA domain-containing Ser/Thr kinase [Streptomyces meridianus]|uniref:non-specific serine/threonine protein kinase n=1 Tax=Streptomyces meridianus TaxID=2938945 RepID=A0ABT0X1J6_9ACTN|nr:Stk1 family PASTA domain-containing Ser/Thr kinase [Streptomyces meridianus]MCM2576430.1 Stk1 family PASTA domain-containing Ser/Thr kinase [Streptomyces meridianus]